MSKIKVGVIFGGRSVEHEVSLLSAKSIIKHIDSDIYDIYPIFIDKNGLWHKVRIDEWLNDGELEVHLDSFLTPSLNHEDPGFFQISESSVLSEIKLDAVFPVLHGTHGEDGTIQSRSAMASFTSRSAKESACLSVATVTRAFSRASSTCRASATIPPCANACRRS